MVVLNLGCTLELPEDFKKSQDLRPISRKPDLTNLDFYLDIRSSECSPVT